MQKTGSFKIRGASYAIKKAVKNGENNFITHSSGNHGSAMAYIASSLGKKATVIAPENSVKTKLDIIRSFGAKVINCGTKIGSREKKLKEVLIKDPSYFIPPYDDFNIVTGQEVVVLNFCNNKN